MVFVTFCIRIYSSRISITTSYIFVFLLIVDRENNNSLIINIIIALIQQPFKKKEMKFF